MRLALTILIFVLTSLLSSAQTVQKGIVQEYNEKAKKTPLAGVELNVRSAQSTVSDKGGGFSLQFQTGKPGQSVIVRRIEKLGYEIFNKEAIDQWNINPDRPFVIVMCRSDRFKQLRDNYEKVASASYARQLKKDQAALEKLKTEGKLKEEEYNKQRAKIIEDYERQLDNLETYVDRFSRIDLSELNSAEQEIIDLVKAGDMEEAIARYDQLNIVGNLLNEIEKRDEIRAAISKLEETEKSMKESNDSLYAMADRHIQTLLLAGGTENNQKVASIYRKIADADTTNVEWLLKTGNFINNYLADHNLALDYYQKALNSAIAQFGTEAIMTSICYNNIGTVYDDMGDHDTALSYYLEALAIDGKNLGSEHRQVAVDYNNIGAVFKFKREYATALEYFKMSLEIMENIYGLNHPDVALRYNNIGALYSSIKEFGTSLEYHNRALEIRSNFYGSESLPVALSLNNIAYVYYSQGDFSTAKDYYMKSLAIRKKILGDIHPDIADSYENIGDLYFSQNDFSSAVDNYNKSLEIRVKVLGQSHPDVAKSYNNIGSVFFSQHEFQLALDNFKKAFSIYYDLNYTHNLEIATLCHNIALAYKSMLDYPSAIEYYLMELPIKQDIFGKEGQPSKKLSKDIIQVYALMAIDCFNSGNIEMALDSYLKGLDYYDGNDVNDKSFDLSVYYFNIGMLYHLKDEYSNALEYYNKALAEYEKNDKEETPDAATTLSNIAMIYEAQENLTLAIENYKKALKILEKINGSDHSEVLLLKEKIASLSL